MRVVLYYTKLVRNRKKGQSLKYLEIFFLVCTLGIES